MWTWKQKSVSVVKQKYGHDEFAPTPDGLFVAYFVGECGVFADCLLCISLVGVVYLRIVRCEFRWWEWCICGLFIACFVV